MKSALYSGWVRHRRFKPKSHEFKYRVFMLYFSLEELSDIFSLSPFWSEKRFSLARFKRADFHGDPRRKLDDCVRDSVEKELGFRPEGDICVLANWRYFGFNMNPLVTYYCYAKGSDKLEAIMAEVSNTPWNERRAYVLACDDSAVKKQDIVFDKDFTVSPFNALDMQYRWRSSLPGQGLQLHIDTKQAGDNITDATLVLEREEISSSSLNRILIRYPLMTLKVFLGIYWQALRLFMKGIPFLGKNKTSTQLRKSELVNDEIH